MYKMSLDDFQQIPAHMFLAKIWTDIFIEQTHTSNKITPQPYFLKLKSINWKLQLVKSVIACKMNGEQLEMRNRSQKVPKLLPLTWENYRKACIWSVIWHFYYVFILHGIIDSHFTWCVFRVSVCDLVTAVVQIIALEMETASFCHTDNFSKD